MCIIVVLTHIFCLNYLFYSDFLSTSLCYVGNTPIRCFNLFSVYVVVSLWSVKHVPYDGIPVSMANASVVLLNLLGDLFDQDNKGMLSLREFCIALYLMERHRTRTPMPSVLPDALKYGQTLLQATACISLPSIAYNGLSWQQNPGNTLLAFRFSYHVITATWHLGLLLVHLCYLQVVCDHPCHHMCTHKLMQLAGQVNQDLKSLVWIITWQLKETKMTELE
jgi:hypothetical protein